MRGGIFFGLISFSVLGSEADLPKFKDRQKLLQEYLHRVENGKDPCFSDECQKRKSELILKIFTVSDTIPYSDTQFFPSRRSGLDSALRLVRKKFILPSAPVPNTSRDWALWWRRRHSHEFKLKSTWLHFQSQVYAYHDGFQAYRKLLNAELTRKNLLEEAIQLGAGRAAELMMEAAKFIERASQLEAQGQLEPARNERRLAVQYTEEREKIEAKFRGQFRRTLETILPDSPFSQILSFLYWTERLTRIYKAPALFDEAFQKRILLRSEETKLLVQLVQEFTDLEYGVVGLKNFYSFTNPQVLSEHELVLQEFLDQVENRAKLILDLGASYFLLRIGPSFIDSPLLTNIALPTLYNLLSIQTDRQASDLLIPSSKISAELQQQLPSLEEQMSQRQIELFKVRGALIEKLKEVELQIQILESEAIDEKL